MSQEREVFPLFIPYTSLYMIIVSERREKRIITQRVFQWIKMWRCIYIYIVVGESYSPSFSKGKRDEWSRLPKTLSLAESCPTICFLSILRLSLYTWNWQMRKKKGEKGWNLSRLFVRLAWGAENKNGFPILSIFRFRRYVAWWTRLRKARQRYFVFFFYFFFL